MPNNISSISSDKRNAWLMRNRFFITHVVTLIGCLFTGFSLESLVLCGFLYLTRMFGVTAGYHRFFSHRSFKTSRAFTFFLAFLAQSSAQRGVIWWARNHRHHHRYSDKPQDLHSPVQKGFWHAHVGWVFRPEAYQKNGNVRDLERIPELVWLDRHPMLPAVVLAVFCTLLMGWEGLFVGFFLSTILLFHGTFTINSLAHVWGSRRFKTTDDSRNNLWLALLTLGEGWHNNHHRYQSSARQGFYWWEIDLCYYALWFLAKCGIIWDLNNVPDSILAEGKPTPTAMET